MLTGARPGEHILYCFFSEFLSGVTFEGEECILFGGGATYIFRKETDGWKGRFFSGWIS
jgi:hypothetical protein